MYITSIIYRVHTIINTIGKLKHKYTEINCDINNQTCYNKKSQDEKTHPCATPICDWNVTLLHYHNKQASEPGGWELSPSTFFAKLVIPPPFFFLFVKISDKSSFPPPIFNLLPTLLLQHTQSQNQHLRLVSGFQHIHKFLSY